MATVKKFKTKFPYSKESIVRTFRDKYRNTLKRNRESSSPLKKLATMTCGRLLMLGKLDDKVKNFLLGLRPKGGVLNTVVAIVAAKALTQKCNEEHLKLIEFGKSPWAKPFPANGIHEKSSNPREAWKPRWSLKRGCTNFSL